MHEKFVFIHVNPDLNGFEGWIREIDFQWIISQPFSKPFRDGYNNGRRRNSRLAKRCGIAYRTTRQTDASKITRHFVKS
jgi:hypothetical protein